LKGPLGCQLPRDHKAVLHVPEAKQPEFIEPL
jgi:hypothetical protein